MESRRERFLGSYIHAALWSSTDGDEVPLDRDYSRDDLAPETLSRMNADCSSFIERAGPLIGKAERMQEETGWLGKVGVICPVLEYAAQDFWLTRNGHGAGFWDGDWPEEISDALDDIAKSFGECDLCVGDDGMIYA